MGSGKLWVQVPKVIFKKKKPKQNYHIKCSLALEEKMALKTNLSPNALSAEK